MADTNRRCKYDGNYPEQDQNEKPIIVVHHDESTFYANADQSRYCGDDYNTVLKQKSLGQSIMISDLSRRRQEIFFVTMMKRPENLWRLSTMDTSIVSSFWNRWILRLTYLKPSFQIHSVCSYLIMPLSIRSTQTMLMNVHPGGKQPIMKDSFQWRSTEDGH